MEILDKRDSLVANDGINSDGINHVLKDIDEFSLTFDSAGLVRGSLRHISLQHL